MEPMKILEPFLSRNEKHLKKPFSKGEYTYASNGHILIRVPRLQVVTLESTINFIEKMKITPEHAGEWIAIPAYKAPKKFKCGTCHGCGFACECDECEEEGVVFWSTANHNYEAECKKCNGEGLVSGGNEPCPYCENGMVYEDRVNPIKIHEETLDIKLLDKIKDLPDVKIFIPSVAGMVSFRFYGGDGVVMALKY